MVGQTSFVPPPYIPLGHSDAVSGPVPPGDARPGQQHINNGPGQWSSGICACFDDIQGCCIGLFCPYYRFGKNAEVLGSGTMVGSCMTHFVLWALVNTFCCVFTEGILLGLPGCFIVCYACGYRSTIRSKYNLQEAPSGGFLLIFAIYVPYVKSTEKSERGVEIQIPLACIWQK